MARKTNFYLSGDLSEHWNLELAWYNFDYYDTDEEEYDYQIGTENYLTYSLPLVSGFSFNIENYVEAYHTPDSDTHWLGRIFSLSLNLKSK